MAFIQIMAAKFGLLSLYKSSLYPLVQSFPYYKWIIGMHGTISGELMKHELSHTATYKLSLHYTCRC